MSLGLWHFSVRAMSDQAEALGDLLLDLDLAWEKLETSCESRDLTALKKETIVLDRRFAEWQGSRVTEFRPAICGHVSQTKHKSDIKVGNWPGKIDTYFDLYVAGVWNIYRAARLLLITLIFKISYAQGDKDRCIDHTSTATRIGEDIIASIPYHLADNLQVFLSGLATDDGITDPGRSLGGLLLIHPLYVASNMPFLPKDMREYMRRCLTWIGSNMGFGQADLLAKVR